MAHEPQIKTLYSAQYRSALFHRRCRFFPIAPTLNAAYLSLRPMSHRGRGTGRAGGSSSSHS